MGRKKIGYWLKEGKAKRIEVSKIRDILSRKYDCGNFSKQYVFLLTVGLFFKSLFSSEIVILKLFLSPSFYFRSRFHGRGLGQPTPS